MNEHTEYLALLRAKVDQLGQLSSKMAVGDNVLPVLALRSDIARMFDHLGIERPPDKRECKCGQGHCRD